MNLQLLCILLIGMACVFGVYRSLVQATRWRWLLACGQVLSAVLLVLTLFPPLMVQSPQTLVVLTPGIDATQLQTLDPGQQTLALPGVEAKHEWIMHAPDLATALRRQPRVAALRILGDGLPKRDLDAVGDRAVEFEPSGQPITGVVDLQFPASVDAGEIWNLTGRVEGAQPARVQLTDRAGAVVAKGAADDQGHFQLSAISRVPGEEVWRLQVLDKDDQAVEQIPLGIRIRTPDSMRGAILSGAPDAELKYLRRWALDAGHEFASEIQLSRGVEQRAQAVSMDLASLAKLDLLIIDERAWAGLSTRNKQDIDEAVRGGLGLLFRVVGKPSAAVIDDWRQRGLQLSPNKGLTEHLAREAEMDNGKVTVGKDRVSLNLAGDELVPLLKDSEGMPIAAWRMSDQGRIGIWLPRDSYTLQLAGQGSRYGTLWSGVFATLARAHGGKEPQLPQWAKVGERTQVCGLQEPAEVRDSSGGIAKLLLKPANPGCASWWPQTAGWNTVRDAAGQWPVFVYARDQATSLFRSFTRDATRQQVNSVMPSRHVATESPRWPWFLAWLLVSASLWWLERRQAKAS